MPNLESLHPLVFHDCVRGKNLMFQKLFQAVLTLIYIISDTK